VRGRVEVLQDIAVEVGDFPARGGGVAHRVGKGDRIAAAAERHRRFSDLVVERGAAGRRPAPVDLRPHAAEAGNLAEVEIPRVHLQVHQRQIDGAVAGAQRDRKLHAAG
jgi:hypothetical protein